MDQALCCCFFPKCERRMMLLKNLFVPICNWCVLYLPGFGIKFRFLLTNLNSKLVNFLFWEFPNGSSWYLLDFCNDFRLSVCICTYYVKYVVYIHCVVLCLYLVRVPAIGKDSLPIFCRLVVHIAVAQWLSASNWFESRWFCQSGFEFAKTLLSIFNH